MDCWYLRNTTAGHNKHYFVWISPNGVRSECDVTAGWGAIGNVPQTKVEGTRIMRSAAVDLAEELVRRKLSRGYRLVWSNTGATPFQTWEEFALAAGVPRGEPGYANMTVPLPWVGNVTRAALRGQTRRRKPKATIPDPPEPPKKQKEDKGPIRRHDADWNF